MCKYFCPPPPPPTDCGCKGMRWKWENRRIYLLFTQHLIASPAPRRSQTKRLGMFDPGAFLPSASEGFHLTPRFCLKVNFLTKLRLKIYDLAKSSSFGCAEQKATVMIFKQLSEKRLRYGTKVKLGKKMAKRGKAGTKVRTEENSFPFAFPFTQAGVDKKRDKSEWLCYVRCTLRRTDRQTSNQTLEDWYKSQVNHELIL